MIRLFPSMKLWMVHRLRVNYLYNLLFFLDESIPIRLFLQAYKNITPTYSNVNNKFSVIYILNLVLVDVEDRKYFKQFEIKLFRLDKNKI